MTFANLGWPLVVLGLGAIAGVLYLLQRLRVRHREVPVITTMFWREAVEESRARVLTKRLRHPWAYALILLIASLLWLGLAGPEGSADDTDRHVVLLDGSARMARGDLFERAKQAAVDTASGLPREAREVVLCGAYPRRVLAPGEDVLLLDKRLEAIEPDACPPTLSAVLRHMTTDEYTAKAFHVVTDPSAWQPEGGWPSDRTVMQVEVESTPNHNRGIVALGLSEAQSGRFDAVDVYVEVRQSPDSEVPAPLQILIGDRPYSVSPASTPAPEIGGTRHWLRGVPARGETLTVRLPGTDDLALDDEADIVLPARRVTRVRIDASLVAAIGPVVDADPALVRDDANPDVRVVREQVRSPRDLPTLAFVAEIADAPMLHVTHPDFAWRSELLLEDVVAELRLGEIDAVELATAAGRPIELVGDQGDVAALSLWQSLLTERYDLVHTRTFPALLSRALRWLADVKPLAPYVAVGEPLFADRMSLTDSEDTLHSSWPVIATPPVAGAYRTRAERVIATLAAPALVGRADAAPASLQPSSASGISGSPATWLLLLAFLLLCFEWFLFRTERIP